MPRNQSVDSQKTRRNLTYYFNEARRKGLLDQILKEGNFNEAAIRTAISRGRISINMINAFKNVMKADVEALVGEKELFTDLNMEKQNNKKDSNYLSDNEMVKIVKLLVVEKNKENLLRVITEILK